MSFKSYEDYVVKLATREVLRKKGGKSCESDAKSGYNVGLVCAASFDSKMGCLYSVFDVKKQGKPDWVVQTRNWKLRGVENRLSGLLEGVSIVSSGRQGSKGDRVKPLFKYGFCECGSVLACCSPNFCLSGVEYRYPNRVSVPKFNTGIWVSVPAREGIGTPGIDTCYQGIDTPLTLH
ncbi:hypothetical protein GQ457_11G030460 [Hibiscus cannabinus]